MRHHWACFNRALQHHGQQSLQFSARLLESPRMRSGDKLSDEIKCYGKRELHVYANRNRLRLVCRLFRPLQPPLRIASYWLCWNLPAQTETNTCCNVLVLWNNSEAPIYIMLYQNNFNFTVTWQPNLTVFSIQVKWKTPTIETTAFELII